VTPRTDRNVGTECRRLFSLGGGSRCEGYVSARGSCWAAAAETNRSEPVTNGYITVRPRRDAGFPSFCYPNKGASSMPTLTTTEHDEIHVHHRQVTRMADRLWCLASPARRTAYVDKARRRLAAGPPRHSDAAIVLAAGDERAPS
jgi:hypothetical protein